MAKNRGLGKGLDSIISDKYSKAKKPAAKAGAGAGAAKSTGAAVKTASAKTVTEAPAQEQVTGAEQMLEIALIFPNREQPRKNFDSEALKELSESIKQHGIISPIIVCKKGGGYEIIAGERRYRAARLAGLKEVPVIVRDYSDKERDEIALIENIQRENLNAIEEAQAYDKLIKDYGLKQEELAKRISKSRTAITNHLRLLKLSDKVQKMVIDGKLTEGHARALLSIEDAEKQEKMAEIIIDKKYSVRDAEKLVKGEITPAAKPVNPAKKTGDDAAYEKLENDLKQMMGTKVSIKRKSEDKGQIVIDYYSIDELDRLTEMFRGGKKA